MGAVVMSAVIGYEIASLVGLIIGKPLPTILLLIFAPFVWLIFEAVKTQSVMVDGVELAETNQVAVAG
jgi:hypothetical protein